MPELAYWHWIVLGLAFLVLEIFAPGAIIMWFGVGAILLGTLMLAGLEMSFGEQMVVFAVLSLVGLIVGRRFLNWSGGAEDKPNLSRRADSFIGQKYLLVKAIENGRGTVRVGDTDWRVTGEDVAVGTIVKVTGVNGATLVVEVPSEAKAEPTPTVTPAPVSTPEDEG